MKRIIIFLLTLIPFALFAQLDNSSPRVKISNGILEGVSSSGISIFKGIPFAAPPVGDLRWKEPQPVKNWQGVRKADQFGPKPMQLPIYGNMNSRSNGMSEDCLYLNVWTPAKSADEKLPVLVYFFGGGMKAGDGSEYRYDGESMAHKGIVMVTVNYRLGVFGFLSHPELSKETSYHGSGNYAYMDQWASLRWVQQNIAAFGGDPKRVTIGGESAGSNSVCAQMASPLSKNLIAGAIGESGSVIRVTLTLAESEAMGVAFAKGVGAKSLADLRAMSAEKLLEESGKPDAFTPTVNLDGYFFTKTPVAIYASGEQAHVPLLLGWNSEEDNISAVLGTSEPTPENYKIAVEKLYGEKAGEVLKLYPGTTIDEVKKSAAELAVDRRSSAFGTWKWCDLCLKTGNSPVYRYFYSRPRPEIKPELGNAIDGRAGGVIINNNSNIEKRPVHTGAVHSAEIEYALGNLPTNRLRDWQPEDYKVSEVMQEYFANFVKTGNPNGIGLPLWPVANSSKPLKVMNIDVNTHLIDEPHPERFEWLDKFNNLVP